MERRRGTYFARERGASAVEADVRAERPLVRGRGLRRSRGGRDDGPLTWDPRPPDPRRPESRGDRRRAGGRRRRGDVHDRPERCASSRAGRDPGGGPGPCSSRSRNTSGSRSRPRSPVRAGPPFARSPSTRWLPRSTLRRRSWATTWPPTASIWGISAPERRQGSASIALTAAPIASTTSRREPSVWACVTRASGNRPTPRRRRRPEPRLVARGAQSLPSGWCRSPRRCSSSTRSCPGSVRALGFRFIRSPISMCVWANAWHGAGGVSGAAAGIVSIALAVWVVLRLLQAGPSAPTGPRSVERCSRGSSSAPARWSGCWRSPGSRRPAPGWGSCSCW